MEEIHNLRYAVTRLLEEVEALQMKAANVQKLCTFSLRGKRLILYTIAILVSCEIWKYFMIIVELSPVQLLTFAIAFSYVGTKFLVL